MTKLRLCPPVEIDINIDDHLHYASLNSLLKEIERRFNDNFLVDKSKLIVLVNCIIKMKSHEAFAILQEITNGMISAENCKQRQLDYLTSPDFLKNPAADIDATTTKEPEQ